MKTRGTGVVLALGLLLASDARAEDWRSFAAAFPVFPCQDGWMGCLVDGARVDPEVTKDAAGRAMASDLRVSWFDLEATATFSPFTALSAYKGAPAVVAAAEPAPADEGDAVADAAEEARRQPSAESRAAQERADEAAADADAARAAQATADREAKEAAAAQKQAELEARRRRDEEAAARREADELARRAQQQASTAQASERAALQRQQAEAEARAAAAAKERLAAEEASRRAREADEAARRKADEEERKRQEADAARLAAETAAREKAEADRRRQEELARQEAERKAAADAAAAQQAATAQAAAQAAAAEQARKAREAEAARVAAGQEPAPAPEPDAVADAGVAPPTAPVDDGTCADLGRMEPTALLGKLSDGQTSCLEGSLAAAPKMTDKKKISLVLQANAWAKGDKATWEQLVKRHLDEIDQSDPDLCYKYAVHLSKMGPGRASGVIRWANVALENRTVWTADTYTSRVYSLYKVRAAASQALWQDAEGEHSKAPSDESRDKVDKYRNMTKVNAREWYEYARSSGKDASTALQLCISAAGTADYCEAG